MYLNLELDASHYYQENHKSHGYWALRYLRLHVIRQPGVRRTQTNLTMWILDSTNQGVVGFVLRGKAERQTRPKQRLGSQATIRVVCAVICWKAVSCRNLVCGFWSRDVAENKRINI